MQRGSSIVLQVPRRLLAGGLVLIGAAAVVSLGFNLSPTRRAWAHYQAGAKISCCGEPDPVAMKHFQTALRLNPRLFEARRGLAAIYVNLGRQREAEGLFEDALRLDRSDPRPYYEMAELAMPENRAQAIRHMEKYLSMHSQDLQAWYLLAYYHEGGGQWKEALQVWESIARRFPGNARAQRSLPRVRKKIQQAARD